MNYWKANIGLKNRKTYILPSLTYSVMNIKPDSWSWGYYPNRIFIFSIPYFILNLLDLIITRTALATTENLYELNPFYYHPYSAPLKISAPILLLAFYLSLYYFNKSEQRKRMIGKYGLRCVIGLTIFYSFICINNLYQWVL